MKEYKKSIINKLSCCFTQYEMNKITIKPLFGGAGVCLNEVMFAWIYDNDLYLRGHADYLAVFTKLTMPPLAFSTGVTVKLLQYYKVTHYLWTNERAFNEIVQMVVKYACSDKVSQCHMKESRIKDLPNMTLSLERSLFRVGVINLACFRRQGSFKCYFKLGQCNKSLSENVLYTLHSALMGTHVATLTEDEKNALRKEYHDFTLSK